jgi:hypothetical protein
MVLGMMKRVFLVLIAVVGVAMGQQPQAPAGAKVEPTEVQTLKLKVAQKDAIIAQQQSQSLHQQAQVADEAARKTLADLQKLAEDVKKEQGWANDVVFDPNQLTFTRTDKPLKP